MLCSRVRNITVETCDHLFSVVFAEIVINKFKRIFSYDCCKNTRFVWIKKWTSEKCDLHHDSERFWLIVRFQYWTHYVQLMGTKFSVYSIFLVLFSEILSRFMSFSRDLCFWDSVFLLVFVLLAAFFVGLNLDDE